MIVLDTCALIFDALTPERLTSAAKRAIDKAEQEKKLFCCDISLWEVGMLIQRQRLDPGVEKKFFLQLMLSARGIQVLPMNVEIADIATNSAGFNHHDPADRIISATAIHYHAKLITADKKIANLSKVEVVW